MSHDHHMHHGAHPVAQEVLTTTAAPVHVHDDHVHDPDGGDMSHMMKMYFHTELGDYVFFKTWQPKSAGDMIWTCIVIAILAMLYEGLKYYREYLLRASRISTYYISSDIPHGVRPPNGTANGNLSRTASRNVVNELSRRMFSSSHIVQTLLHMLQFLISYLLMLVFMTYNVYLCIAVIVGATIGYFLFGWYKSFAVDITEHCQ